MDEKEYRAKTEIQQDFPNLKSDEFDITSRINFCYNCFAWAAGYDHVLMQPSNHTMYHWLTGEIGETLDNFEKQFQLLGFEKTDSDKCEEEIEKAAFYVKDGIVLHASRQLENGWWASKLGQMGEDIEHKTLKGLEGEEYGQVEMIMKRPVTERVQVKDEERISEDAFENFKNLAKNLINVPKKEVDNLKNNKNKRKAEK